MSAKTLFKNIMPFIEAGNDGDVIAWDSSKQYGFDNVPMGRGGNQQEVSTAAAGVSTGTSTAYVVGTSPARSANVKGDRVAFTPHVTNGSTPTLAVGGAPALPILINGVAPSSTAMVDTKMYQGVTDGVSWHLA